MHYYQFNIGDYASHTRYLTPIQDLAYRRLLDLYYLQEKPIPKENAAVIIGLNDCSTDVERVLNEYFLLTEKGWVNKRADEAIREFHGKKKTASLAGKKSAAARRANKDGSSERPLNEPINIVQPTIKHKPITKKHITTIPPSPDGVSQSVWDDFVKQRQTKRASITYTAIQGIEREAKKANMSLNDALQEICARGWTGFKAEWVVEKQQTMSTDIRDW
tara:strand:+ start:351 stop:1007 length:657 start_codon:yes stop_codon:yes gene_type:complete